MSGDAFLFEVSGSNVKAFVCAVQALASVGKEVILQIERRSKALTLCALNDNASSFGSVTFKPAFFQRADVNVEDTFACKLVLGALMPLLRRASRKTHSAPQGSGSAAARGSGVVKLVIRLEDGSQPSNASSTDSESAVPKLVFELHHDDGVRRRWKLFYEAADMTRAVFNTDAEGVGRIVAQPHQFSAILDHIRNSPEVEIGVTRDGLKIRSRDDVKKSEKNVATTMSAKRSDFEIFTLPAGDATGIAVGVKAARAVVKFCDEVRVQTLDFHYKAAGHPVAFSAESASGCVANFVISSSKTQANPRNEAEAHKRPRAPATPAREHGENAMPESRHSRRKHTFEPPPRDIAPSGSQASGAGSQASGASTSSSVRRRQAVQDENHEDEDEEERYYQEEAAF
ncbi:Rad9-domain-containing protein [Pelagophyceae sp. CCMP2097]|nr:Rad9-domain-containing protein [Pelagophyceae sp. CCMP2097]